MNQNGPSADLNILASSLVAYEESRAASNHSSIDGSPMSAAASICEKLRRPLSVLAGNTGSIALLARALSVAKKHTAALAPVQFNEFGALANYENVSAVEVTEASIGLIAHLLALLVTLIGEFLTMRIVDDVWPDLPPKPRGEPNNES